jgi:DNA polymerase
MTTPSPLARLLDWYIAMGVDEAIAFDPQDRLATTPAVAPPSLPIFPIKDKPARVAPGPVLVAPIAAAATARELAFAAHSLTELEAAIRSFDGCALKRTATNTVFADGDSTAPLMVIGEAPGADEDRIGRPFVGRAGQLLDRMLAAIGLDRTTAYITNVLFWRPPGNRKPTNDEIAACLPFVWRHIALKRPRVLMLAGGTSASTLLGRSEGIMRLRGRWTDLTVPDLAQPVPALATFHPSFLLRAPARKAEAWVDLLSLKARLETLH